MAHKLFPRLFARLNDLKAWKETDRSIINDKADRKKVGQSLLPIVTKNDVCVGVRALSSFLDRCHARLIDDTADHLP